MNGKVLKFRKKYKDKIISGKKTTTIRLETKLKPGDTVFVKAGNETIGTAKIIGVTDRKLKDLTEEDAGLDGFRNLRELRAELKDIYGPLNEETTLKLVRFRFKPKATDKDM